MNRKPEPGPDTPPDDEDLVRGWYTTFNEEGEFPNGYDDGDGSRVFAMVSIRCDDAWIAVPSGVERDLVEWR